MEQIPHHREGIQNELDKAYDEGHRDNKAFDEARIRSEGETHISDEEMQSHFSEKEKAMVAGKEKEVSPELAETLVRLREKGYLDTSFEGKEVHELNVRALSKEEALAEYGANSVMITGYLEEQSVWPWRYKTMMYTESARNQLDSPWTLCDIDQTFELVPKGGVDYRYESKKHELEKYRASGGRVTWVWDEVEMKMPYVTPNAERLDVMIMKFNKKVVFTAALAKMDVLGVRPLTYEELIQYGIAHPSHQTKNELVGLGSSHILTGVTKAENAGDTEQFADQLFAPALLVDDDTYGQGLSAVNLNNPLSNKIRFLVVHK